MTSKYQGLTFIGYARVSTKDQKTDIQVKNIHDISEVHKTHLDHIYIDEGKHGWILDNEEFQNMLNHLSRVDGLYLEHNDRFARGNPEDPTSIIDMLNIFRSISKQNKIVYSIQEGELKMESLIEVVLMTIRFYDSSNRIVIDKKKQKDGIKRYIEKYGRWGPTKKKLNIKQYDLLRDKGLSKISCAKLMGMSIATLNRLLHEYGVNDFEQFKVKSIES